MSVAEVLSAGMERLERSRMRRQKVRQSKTRWMVSGIVVALILGGAYQVWNRTLRDQLFPKRFAEVESGSLYRSGQIAPRLVRDVLREHSIGLVVWLSDYDQRKPHHRAEKAAIDELGIDRLNLHLRGNGTGELDHYVEALEAISQAKHQHVPVLVHCAAGIRRTGAVMALYELLVEGQPPAIAYRELVRFGEHGLGDSPLVPFLNRNMAAIAAGLVRRGVIESAPDPLPVLHSPV
jgi:protein tyrosine/serine phosphatase